jgi:putative transposase
VRTPYHIGIRVKLYPSDRQKKIIAVNTGAQRAVYNLLVATHQEIYRMRKASACVPAYRNRIDYLNSRVSSTAEIRNALPFLSEPEIDGQVIANGHVNYRRAWKNAKSS